jgi:hypothetical protein
MSELMSRVALVATVTMAASCSAQAPGENVGAVSGADSPVIDSVTEFHHGRSADATWFFASDDGCILSSLDVTPSEFVDKFNGHFNGSNVSMPPTTASGVFLTFSENNFCTGDSRSIFGFLATPIEIAPTLPGLTLVAGVPCDEVAIVMGVVTETFPTCFVNATWTGTENTAFRHEIHDSTFLLENDVTRVLSRTRSDQLGRFRLADASGSVVVNGMDLTRGLPPAFADLADLKRSQRQFQFFHQR